MSSETSSWPSPGESTPPLTATRLTAGPDVPASRSNALMSPGSKVSSETMRDGLALAVETERAQALELVDAIDDRRRHPAVGAGRDRAAEGGAFARSGVETVDGGDQPGQRARHARLADRRLERPAGGIAEVASA